MSDNNEVKPPIPNGMFDPLFYDDTLRKPEVVTKPFDASKYIVTEKDRQELMEDALSTGHPGYIAAATQVVDESIENEKMQQHT